MAQRLRNKLIERTLPARELVGRLARTAWNTDAAAHTPAASPCTSTCTSSASGSILVARAESSRSRGEGGRLGSGVIEVRGHRVGRDRIASPHVSFQLGAEGQEGEDTNEPLWFRQLFNDRQGTEHKTSETLSEDSDSHSRGEQQTSQETERNAPALSEQSTTHLVPSITPQQPTLAFNSPGIHIQNILSLCYTYLCENSVENFQF